MKGAITSVIFMPSGKNQCSIILPGPSYYSMGMARQKQPSYNDEVVEFLAYFAVGFVRRRK